MTKKDDLFANVALAVRKLSQAASGTLGRDCYQHARLAALLLEENGVTARVVSGYAAWRVGSDDSAVVMHCPSVKGAGQTTVIEGEGALMFHAWIEAEGQIFDVTTYQLRQKTAELDRIDGQETDVSWCPDYLLFDADAINSLADVIQLDEGMRFYHRVPEIEQIMRQNSAEIDADEIGALRLILENPQVLVFGPTSEDDEILIKEFSAAC